MTRRSLSPLLTRGLIVATLVAIAVALSSAGAQTISGSGGWTVTVSSANLQSGAGSNLTPTLSSPSNATLLTVNPTFFSAWHVTVSANQGLFQIPAWPSALHLQARRTGSGSTLGSPPTGGTSYLTLTGTAQTFFSGSAISAYNNIPIQYRLTGLSLQIPVGNYSITVTYTVLNG